MEGYLDPLDIFVLPVNVSGHITLGYYEVFFMSAPRLSPPVAARDSCVLRPQLRRYVGCPTELNPTSFSASKVNLI